MKVNTFAKVLAVGAMVALAACSGGNSTLPSRPAVVPQSTIVADDCAMPDYSIPGAPHCYALHRTDIGGGTGIKTLGSRTANALPAGYGRPDLISAYKLPTTGGTGQTIGIVDFYDDPNVESDLAVYRSTYGLSPCTTANGCFKKVNQDGVQGNYPHANRSWAGEISLDVDMASAICPNCKILLVEVANDANAGENTAINLGANVVSNSWGASLTAGYNAAFDHPGHIITVASGDKGFSSANTYPDSYGTIVSVGGTTLNQASNARGWTESAWNGSTSECNTSVTKPAWQKDTGCSGRTETDVSAVADPNTGLAVYLTYGGNGWTVYGGTSAASPIVAGIYALAGNESTLNYAQSLYTNASSLFDVTTGSNGSCGTYICNAGVGYDGPTGNGTPNGLGAF